ncbi:MAG: hypothetical protein HPY61_01690 [Methanotrichaceae archaeon]|nr:hypothetical protein [Methanotrichaceae archaeon]
MSGKVKSQRPNRITGLAICCLSIVYFSAIIGSASVALYGSFYNSEGALSLSEVGENVDLSGNIILLPSSGFSEYPFSLYSKGSGHPIGGSTATRFSFELSAEGNEKTVFAESIVREDPSIRSVVSTEWGHELVLGEVDTGKYRLNQFTNIVSHPGYLTFPTSGLMDTVSAGMTFEAFKDGGMQLLEKQRVPNQDYGEYPIVLGVMKGAYDNVYMENKLDMSAEW